MTRSRRRQLKELHREKKESFCVRKRDTVDGRPINDLRLSSISKIKEERDSNYQDIPYVDMWDGLVVQ